MFFRIQESLSMFVLVKQDELKMLKHFWASEKKKEIPSLN